MKDFQFTDEQFVEAQEIWRDINTQCKILQETTGCPNSEIIKMIDSAKSYWENKNHKESKTTSDLATDADFQ